VTIKQVKGVIKELGPYTSAADAKGSAVNYTYIEFTDGQILRKIVVLGGLDGKLSSALLDTGPIELHLLDDGKNGALLIAVRTEGKLYASDLSEFDSKVLTALVGVSLLVGGLLLLRFYGLGLILLWGAWRVLKSGGLIMTSARKYVRSLPDAIFV